ncbi:MAG TPA: 30S ribosomal protein S5 [Acidobacteriota bacterium]|nr:30S ribosomal protein S5 [Acidobacteriota bacterium]
MNEKPRYQSRDKKRAPRKTKRDDEQSGVYLAQSLEAWQPKTELGRRVKAGEFKDADLLFNNGYKIMEAQIADMILPNLESDLLMIGQSKGKFGGGQRRAFKQTQKKTKEGNKPSFTTYAVVGNKNGYVGLGSGKSKETVPAREKAVRNAKLNMIKVLRGNGSWQTATPMHNSVPFKVTGSAGSIRITLIPAPVGTGLVIEKECAKMLRLAGITDVWSRMSGNTATKINVVKACFDALQKLADMKVAAGTKEALGMTASRKIMTPDEISKEGGAQ